MSLTVRTIRSIVKAQTPGMWAHKRGLYLVVSPSGTPTWGLRYSTNTGKRRLMTLEAYEPIDDAKLAALEADAADHRKAIKTSADPLAERNAKAAALTIEMATTKLTNPNELAYEKYLNGDEQSPELCPELREALFGSMPVIAEQMTTSEAYCRIVED